VRDRAGRSLGRGFDARPDAGGAVLDTRRVDEARKKLLRQYAEGLIREADSQLTLAAQALGLGQQGRCGCRGWIMDFGTDVGCQPQ